MRLCRSRAGLAAVLLTSALPLPSEAQVLFDWPVRSTTAPEALTTGAPALLWNPAGASRAISRDRQIWVVHVDGPDASGIQGLAGAFAFDLPVIGRVGAAYQHLGVPDIPLTTESPEPLPGSLTVTEDLLVLSLARSLMEGTGLGASVRFMRGTVGSDRRDRVSVDVGAQTRFGGEPAAGVGAVLRSVGTRTTLIVGGDARLPLPWPELDLRGGYGLQTLLARVDPVHQVSLRGVWDRTLVVGAGTLVHPEGAWTGLFEVRVDIGRYSLGAVREGLPNAFGASYAFQISIDLNTPDSP